MASLSNSEPMPQKRLKLDAEPNCGQNKEESVDWRSKLARNFDEVDVGITEFIGDFKPFEGVLKNRSVFFVEFLSKNLILFLISYEDFLVHEITKSGQIVRLTDNRKPIDEVIPVLDIYEVLDDNTIEQIKELLTTDKNNDIEDKLIDTNLETIDSQNIIESEIESICETEVDTNSKSQLISDKSGETVIKISVNGLSKFERTRIHKAIKDNYEKLETLTVDEELNKYIVVKRLDKNSVKRRPNQWPQR